MTEIPPPLIVAAIALVSFLAGVLVVLVSSRRDRARLDRDRARVLAWQRRDGGPLGGRP